MTIREEFCAILEARERGREQDIENIRLNIS